MARKRSIDELIAAEKEAQRKSAERIAQLNKEKAKAEKKAKDAAIRRLGKLAYDAGFGHLVMASDEQIKAALKTGVSQLEMALHGNRELGEMDHHSTC